MMMLLLLLTLLSILTTNHSLVEESEVNCDGRSKASDCNKLEQRLNLIFGLMLSFPDFQGREHLASSFDDGYNKAPAAYLAVKQVNNRTDLLKDYDIEILQLDGGCDTTTRTVIGANELVCSCKFKALLAS